MKSDRDQEIDKDLKEARIQQAKDHEEYCKQLMEKNERVKK